MTIAFDPASELRWKILWGLSQSLHTINYAQGARLLETALADARALLRRHSQSRLELEKTTLALARQYLAWGDFEQNTPRAAELYRRAAELLATNGPFRQESREADRQSLLASSYLALGNFQLEANRPQEAVVTYTAGINLTGRAVSINLMEESPLMEVQGMLHVQRGMAALLLDKPEDARSDYEIAVEKLNSGLNSFYFGPLALLAGQEAEALAQYEGIFDENAWANAWFDLQQLAENLPAHRMRIEQFIPAMQTAVWAKHPGLDTLYVGYLLANFRRLHFSALGQWPAALAESEHALRYAERALNANDKAYDWQERWLDAQLNTSYHLLLARAQDTEALSRVIRYAEQGERYILDVLPYYANAAYLKTNHAHALLLRNAPGDRARAITLYQEFMLAGDAVGNDPWEVLHKDFRDMHVAGVQWPRLQEVIQAIKPADVVLSSEDWREMGVVE